MDIVDQSEHAILYLEKRTLGAPKRLLDLSINLPTDFFVPNGSMCDLRLIITL